MDVYKNEDKSATQTSMKDSSTKVLQDDSPNSDDACSEQSLHLFGEEIERNLSFLYQW